MSDDQTVCLCFNVSQRKIVQFIRTQKPVMASQLSECFGAGTGCGWCRPFLKRLWESETPDSETLPTPDEYAAARAAFREKREDC